MTRQSEIQGARRWLDVRPGEGRATALMVAHSFFTGTSTVFLETAASALFLSRYDASVLPFVYLAAAAVSILTGFAYTRVKERVAFAPLMLGTLGLMLAMVCLLRVGLGIVHASWIVLGMMVGYRLLSILTDLEYWAVAARLYDVQQSKRLFSLIGSGEVTARIGGAFSVPLLVRLVGVENLVWLSAFGLTACLALLLLLFRSFPDITSRAATDETPEAARRRESLRPIRSSSYLRIVFTLALFAVLGKYFVDFAFLSQMQTRWQAVDTLASFFGLFSGITQVVNLSIRVLVSGRLLSRFGIRLGLLVLPVAHFLCTLGILFVASIPAPVAVFWLVITNQGIYKVFKHPVDNPSFKILYQPLPRHERLAAQIGVEVIVTPVAIAVAATLMLVFEASAPASPIAFACLMLVNFVAWSVAALFAYREYGAALVRALKKRTLDGASFTLEDEKSIALVREKLKSDYPGDVIFALDLLERIDHPKLEEQWSSLLEHVSADVRRYVLLQIAEKRPLALSEDVSRRVIDDTCPKVRDAALRALAALGDPDGLVLDFLRHPDATLERGALIGLLQSPVERARRRAAERMEELSRSSTARDRALLARVAGETGWGEPSLIVELLADEREAVRREALKAVGRRGDAQALSRLVDHFSEPRYRGEASRALLEAGERVDVVLAEALVDEARPMTARARVARVAGRRRGFARPEALWQAYATGDKGLRAEALAALSAIDHRPANGEGNAVLAHVRREVEEATWELAALATLEGQAGFGPLEASLREEVEQSRERVFLLLSFLYDDRTILSARDNLASRSREKRAYAAEILEVTLSSELKEMTLPLLDDASPGERLRRLRARFPQRNRDAEASVEAILRRTDHRLRDWTKACAIYGAGSFRSTGLLKSLRVLRNARNPLIAETAHWASNRILGERPKANLEENNVRGNGMLTIEKVILLKGVSMFAETSEEILADVATRLEEVELRPRELIFSKGEPGESMYIVVSGKVRVFDGEKTINFLGEREIFGELALLDPEPRSASVDAEEETRLFRLDRDTLFDLMTDNVGVVSGIMQVLCRRLRRITGIATGEGR